MFGGGDAGQDGGVDGGREIVGQPGGGDGGRDGGGGDGDAHAGGGGGAGDGHGGDGDAGGGGGGCPQDCQKCALLRHIGLQPHAHLDAWVELPTLHNASEEQLSVLTNMVMEWQACDAVAGGQGARDFVLGMAGNGKSALCRLAKWVGQRKYGDEDGIVVSTAPTNAAADNVGGVRSLESLLWVAFRWQQEWSKHHKFTEWRTQDFVDWLLKISHNQVLNWIRALRVLVLDEAGMLYPKLFSALMVLIGKYNPKLHVICGADFHQLMAFVGKDFQNDIVMDRGVEFLFELPEFQQFRLFSLEQHMRGDRTFYQRLCNIGKGIFTPDDMRYWKQPMFEYKEPEWRHIPYTLVTTRRTHAAAENQAQWSQLGGPVWQWPWQIWLNLGFDASKLTQPQKADVVRTCTRDLEHQCNYGEIRGVVPGGFTYKLNTRVIWGWKCECRLVQRCGNGSTDFHFVPGRAQWALCLKGKQGTVVGHMWPGSTNELQGSVRVIEHVYKERREGTAPDGFPVVEILHNGQPLLVLVQYHSYVRRVPVDKFGDVPMEISLIPLRYGWATTVHSTQSCTLGHVLLDLRDFFFAYCCML
jgi:hypothetical protein